MSKQVTYAQLFQLLADLDFEATSVKDSHEAYRHAGSDTLILFGRQDPKETVTPHDLVKVRRVLDERGVLSADEFSAFVANGTIPDSRRA